MKCLKIRHPYLSKTPFANGPQNLKMVKVDCKRKRGKERNKSDLPNLAWVPESPSYIPTRVPNGPLASIALHLPWQHSTMEGILFTTFYTPPNCSPVGIWNERHLMGPGEELTEKNLDTWSTKLLVTCCCSLCQDDFFLPLILVLSTWHSYLIHSDVTHSAHLSGVQGVSSSSLMVSETSNAMTISWVFPAWTSVWLWDCELVEDGDDDSSVSSWYCPVSCLPFFIGLPILAISTY